MKKWHSLLFVFVFTLTACGAAATEPPPPTETSTPIIVYITATSQPTLTPTITFTPGPTNTVEPSVTPTPEFSFPTVTVNKQAHCRYGPSAAFLHAADLYAGDTGTVRNRAMYSNWLYIKFDKLNYFCWVHHLSWMWSEMSLH
ncbi:MAG TPA: hypothetical protein PLR93_07000 [Anaerolineales bacterium]|nr:hypothetical protein [Anaerolineales bacterium]